MHWINVRMNYLLLLGTVAWISLGLLFSLVFSLCSNDGGTTPPTETTSSSSSSSESKKPVEPTDDNTPPTLNIVQPESDTTIEAPFLIMGTCIDDSPIRYIEIQIDEHTPILASGTDNWSTFLEDLSLGEHTITATAIDSYDNSTTETVTFTLSKDTTMPSVSIVEPVQDQWYKDFLIVQGTATDNTSIEKIELQVDAEAYQMVSLAENWSQNLSGLTPGIHYITVRVTDEYGNQSSTAVSFQVETTPPTLSILEPDENATFIGAVDIIGKANDGSGSGIDYIEVSVDDGDWYNATGSEDWTYTWDASAEPVGEHTIKARSVDTLGYMSEEATVTIQTVVRSELGDSINHDTPNAVTGICDIAMMGNTPYVTFLENNGEFDQVRVFYWDGSAWVDLPGPISNNSDRHSYKPAIAIDSSNDIYVTWNEADAGKQQIYVKEWDGSAWVNLGAQPLNLNVAQHAKEPDIATYGSVVYVTFYEHNGTEYTIYTKKYDGGWSSLGGGMNYEGSTRHAYDPAIAIQPSSQFPHVVFSEYEGSDYIGRHREWNGSSWTGLNKFSIDHSSRNTWGMEIVFDGDNPCFAWREQNSSDIYNIRCRCYEGSWANKGGWLNNYTNLHAGDPSFAIHDGVYYLAWHEYNGSVYEVYLNRWNGTDWEEIERSSDYFDHVDVTYPALAITHDADPTLYMAYFTNDGTVRKARLNQYELP